MEASCLGPAGHDAFAFVLDEYQASSGMATGSLLVGLPAAHLSGSAKPKIVTPPRLFNRRQYGLAFNVIQYAWAGWLAPLQQVEERKADGRH